MSVGMVDFSDQVRQAMTARCQAEGFYFFDISLQATWVYMTESVKDLLGEAPLCSLQDPLLTLVVGYNTGDLIGHSSISLVHPDETDRLRQLHLCVEQLVSRRAALKLLLPAIP